MAESVSEGVVEDFAAFWGNAEERFSDGHDVMLLYVRYGMLKLSGKVRAEKSLPMMGGLFMCWLVVGV